MGLGMNIAIVLIVALCYSSLKAEGRMISDQTAPKDIDPDLLDFMKDDENAQNEDPTSTVSPSLAELKSGSEVKSCLRLRVLQMLIRVLMVRASGFNINQLRQGSSVSSGSSGPASKDLGLSDDDLEELCRELCEAGVCPPGCPQDMLPPWGK